MSSFGLKRALGVAAAHSNRRCTPTAFGLRRFSADTTTVDLSWKLHGLEPDQGPKTEVEVNKDQLVKMFKDMSYIRRIEIVSDNLYKAKKIRGFCHLYDGQEAVCVGMEAGITRNDHIITAYRDHGYQWTRGDNAFRIFAEQMGKISGCSRGKGGSMHLYWPEGNFYGGNGIVGAQVPVGTGIALASKLKKDGTVAFAAYGDGAANQGQIYESMNMAALWKLPMVFVCENNLFAMGTAVHRHAANPNFYQRGHYVPGVLVDGMNVVACMEAARWAREWCRAGNGPLVLEFRTYRYHGHSMSDPGTAYRTKDEVSDVRKANDPIELVRSLLVETMGYPAEDLKAEEKQIRKEVADAAKQAEDDGMLTEDQLILDIYETGPPPFVRFSDFPDSIEQKA